MTALPSTALLADKVAIVTGAGDGIGRGIALVLAGAGAHVGVCALHEPAVRDTAAKVVSVGRRAPWNAFDASDEAAVERFVFKVAAELGPPTILICNAATMPVVEIEHMAEADIDACYDAKLKSAVLFSKHCIPHMRKAREGTIIFMASVSGHVGFPRHAVYGAMNAGLQGLARGLAMELAPHGIRVNSVSPGTVDSAMLNRYIADSGEDEHKLRAAFDAAHPRGRIGSVEEVAQTFLFLASPLSANITGADLRCDGGFSVKGGQAGTGHESRSRAGATSNGGRSMNLIDGMATHGDVPAIELAATAKRSDDLP
jgi:NAD(P)-dependent dehydrogenase (short-subunit alcohol dehydrogenase family)